MAYVASIRLFVVDDLGPGAAVTLDRGQSHYLVNVMRKGAGTPVLLFNGRDGEWLGTIASADKKAAVIDVDSRTRPHQAEPDVWLLFAPLKKDRTDFLVEKATELGASRLKPVLTARTQGGRVNIERLQATATESAEQSRRLTVPTIDDAVPLPDVLNDWPANRPLVHLDENGTGAPLAEILQQGTQPLAFLIGPEGGFDDAEIAALARHPQAVAADLGPRILRAETAATAALSIRQGVEDAHQPDAGARRASSGA